MTMTRMTIRLTLAVGLALAVAASTVFAQDAGPLKTEKDKRSYALGMDLGAQLRKLSVDVDPAVFAKGLGDALAGGKTLLTDADVKAAIASIQAEAKARQMQAMAAVDAKRADENTKAGAAFLEANKKKPGVVTLPSGLQYKVISAGTGKKPTLADTVVCQYRGTLIDGTEFDSSYSRSEPATFKVTGVIPGWTEALQLMPVGSKWQIVVPPALAYGPRGSGDKIGPDATLVFEIELLSIK
jgi:FKBP-type peptidyl-prolyl cis-trans isomerase FklB